MENKKNIAETVISNAFSTWANKKWFQAIFIVYTLLIPVAFFASPFIYKQINSITTSQVVSETMIQHDTKAKEEHRAAFIRSKQTYAEIKKIMGGYLPLVDCENIFLIEYHNGAENTITGLQFCKFDITLEVGEDVPDIVKNNKFKDENILKYDVLLSDKLNNNKAIFFAKDQFAEVDSYLALQLEYLNAQSYALINLCDPSGVTWGSLLFVSTNQHMIKEEIYSCARAIELVVNPFSSQK